MKKPQPDFAETAHVPGYINKIIMVPVSIDINPNSGSIAVVAWPSRDFVRDLYEYEKNVPSVLDLNPVHCDTCDTKMELNQTYTSFRGRHFCDAKCKVNYHGF